MLWTRPITMAILCASTGFIQAQAPRDIVKQAVQTELDASRDDHSHWLYFEIDRQPSKTVKQWVAQARLVSLERVVERNGQTLPEDQQRQEMSAFMSDSHAQASQRKSGQHDDEQAAELLQDPSRRIRMDYGGREGEAASFSISSRIRNSIHRISKRASLPRWKATWRSTANSIASSA